MLEICGLDGFLKSLSAIWDDTDWREINDNSDIFSWQCGFSFAAVSSEDIEMSQDWILNDRKLVFSQTVLTPVPFQ